MTSTAVACGLYLVTMGVGIVAWFSRAGFGRLHHALYFVTFVAAGVAAWRAFHPGLVLTLLALAGLPLTRPRTRWHPGLAVIGLVGYGAVFLFPHGS